MKPATWAAALSFAGGIYLALGAPPASRPSLTTSGGKVENYFRAVVEYFPQGSAKTVLEGKSAQPQPNGELLIQQLRLTSFEAPGKTNFIVEAPACFYDSAKKLAHSSGRLVCYTADRKFSIGGEGFQWREMAGTLIISNNVHTVIQHELMTRQFKP